jgi:hypothetical protein
MHPLAGIGIAHMEMNNRRTRAAGRDRILRDLLRAVGDMRVELLHRVAVDRGLDNHFRHARSPCAYQRTTCS